MGIFDFLKSKNDESESLSLEEIVAKAAIDVAYRPLFYRKLLQSDLFVLTMKTEDIPEGEFLATSKTTLAVRMLKDNVVPIFTSTERIFDNNVIKEQVNYAKLNASAIFRMFKNDETFFLNPYSDTRKILLPDEVRRLLANDFFKSGETQTMKKGETYLLGLPANYPINLVETLKRYFETRKEIEGAYLALIFNQSQKEDPHLILGIGITKNEQEIFEEISEIIRPYLEKFGVIDLVAKESGLFKSVKSKQYKIY